MPTALTSDVQIVNLALTRLGDLRIAALSDATPAAQAANAVYASLRDEVLRAHPWNFAIQRATCGKVADAAKTITNVSGTTVTTSTPHGYVTGDEVRLVGISGLSGANGVYFTIDVTSTVTFTLRGTAPTGAYVSGGLSLRTRTKRLAEPLTISGISQANPGVVTLAAGHGLVNGDEVYLSGIVGMTELNGRYFTVGSAGATTIELQDTNTSALTAYTSGGSLQLVRGALWDWTTQCVLPSDCLRVLEVQDDDFVEWSVEAGGVLALDENATIPAAVRYIARVTDVRVFDPLFVDALAARITAELAIPLAQDADLHRVQLSLYQAKLQEAREKDALEQTPADFDEDDWITVRG